MSRRILVTGDAGRGKTTFASKLAKKLGVLHFSTDDFYFEKKFTVPRDREESIRKIHAEVYDSLDSWVVDGTTKHLIQGGLEKSDAIYLLEFDNIIHQYASLIKRNIQRRFDDGPDESLRELFGMFSHVTRKRYDKGYKSHKSHHYKMLEPFKHKIVRVNSFRQINDILTGSK